MSLTKVPNTMLENPGGGGGGGGGTAASVSYVPTAPLTGTNVQTALDQLAISSGATGVTTLRADLLDATGAAGKGGKLVGFKETGTGTVGRLVDSKLNDFVNIKDFGATVDGIVDDSAAVTAANSELRPIHVPMGIAKTSIGITSLSARFVGPGQIQTNTTLRGKQFSAIKAPPTSLGNEGSIDTAFSGDWSKQNFSVEHRVTGSTTLGQPTTGYLYTPEAMPHYTYLHNESGWNQGLGDNSGRTGICAFRTRVNQAGQGDAVCYNGSVQVSGARSGATDFLANPAGTLINGDMGASNSGVYLNPYETIVFDNGFDVACVGVVNNFVRTNNTGALSAIWNGYRAQNFGTKACDALISATGLWQTGLDFSMTSLSFTNRAAVVLKQDQRIYLNGTAASSGALKADWRCTNTGGDWIGYDSAAAGVVINSGGNPSFQVSGSTVAVKAGFAVYKGATLIADFANAVSNKIFLGNAGYTISLNQRIELTSQITASSATAGGASALPATPFTYVSILIDNVAYKIPVYNT